MCLHFFQNMYKIHVPLLCVMAYKMSSEKEKEELPILATKNTGKIDYNRVTNN